MIEVAADVLKRKRKSQKFDDIYSEVSTTLGFSDEEKEQNIARFYTDLSLSATFIYTGENEWDLKDRRPIELWDKDASYFIDPEEIKKKKTERAKERLAALKKEEERLEKIRSKEVDEFEEEVEVDPLEEVMSVIGEAEETPAEEAPAKKEKEAEVDQERIEEDFDLIDEEDYNKIMDDYEDLYEEK